MKIMADNVHNRSFFIVLCLMMITLNAGANDSYVFGSALTSDYWKNTNGGIHEDHAYLSNLDLTLEIDAAEAWGRQGGTAFVHVLYNNSKTLSGNIVGDAQTVSNIDNDHVIRLYELWYEQTFGNDKSLKFGLYDLNSEFDAIDTAGLFLNSSHGIGPDYSQTGENGPSIFPVTSLAVRYFQPVGEKLSVQLAVLDAVPGDPSDSQKNTIDLRRDEGALVALEANYHSGRQRFGLGSWYYSKKFDTLDGDSQAKNFGYYGIFEQQLMSSHIDGRDLSFYLRYGRARESVNQVGSYIGAGIVVSGLLPGRPNDTLGLAVANARNGDDYRNVLSMAGGNSDRREINYELTYRAEISKWLTIQPDIQYIKDPGTDPTLDNVLIFGIRIEIGL